MASIANKNKWVFFALKHKNHDKNLNFTNYAISFAIKLTIFSLFLFQVSVIYFPYTTMVGTKQNSLSRAIYGFIDGKFSTSHLIVK